jgi:hypothetical protein
MFFLFVGCGGLRGAQDWLRTRLLFSSCIVFLRACFGVGYAFFSTRNTWLHEAVGMWKHVSIAFACAAILG